MTMAQYAYNEYKVLSLGYLNRKVEEYVTGYKVNLTRDEVIDKMMTFRFGKDWKNKVK